MSGSEDSLLAWLRQQPGTDLLGNDAAELITDADRGSAAPSSHLIATVDSQIEGVHFVPGLDPFLVGRRLFRVNASDLAAMGAQPRFALLALSAPVDFDRERLLRGLLVELTGAGARLAGGDLARSPVPTASLTLLGATDEGVKPLQRDSARPGQILWVGGSLGESALGLAAIQAGFEARATDPIETIRSTDVAIEMKIPSVLPDMRPGTTDDEPRLDLPVETIRQAVIRHLLPTPQGDLGRWLAQRGSGAALDVSDGLARDLARLCRESGVGAIVDLGSIPIAPNLNDTARLLGREPRDLIVGGGEDYVLLFTLDRGETPPPEFRCAAIGRITEDRGLVLRHQGSPIPWPSDGWDHLAQ